MNANIISLKKYVHSAAEKKLEVEQNFSHSNQCAT